MRITDTDMLANIQGKSGSLLILKQTTMIEAIKHFFEAIAIGISKVFVAEVLIPIELIGFFISYITVIYVLIMLEVIKVWRIKGKQSKTTKDAAL
ncbi:MAG: hypothetical protein RQ875_14770 [Vicingaceae bacterium]|nr:hypothetical protein [Vicingaceae bacterium]